MHDLEEYELPGHTYFDLINIDAYVAIYSDRNANVLFYVGKVIEKGEAVSTNKSKYIKDDWGHPVKVGEKFVTIHYMEKEESKSKRGKMFYKELRNKKAYVLPGEIFYPCVPMNPDSTLDIGDYHFLSGCLPQRK